MKSPLSPPRASASIEPLEARIAPAALFIGDPNPQNHSDTEYVELDTPPPSKLHFVSTSKVSTDLVNFPEGDPNNPDLPNSDAISLAVDGAGFGTYYLRLYEGDVVFHFTDNGYKELVRVRTSPGTSLGSAIAFFTDYNHNLEYDDGEFSGLSMGPNASVLVSDKLFGDVVTNLKIGNLSKTTPVARRDVFVSLDMSGLVNFRQGIQSLTVAGGSIFSGNSVVDPINDPLGNLIQYGKVLTGGTIQHLSIGGTVGGVYVGTATLGKTYDFFPNVPGGAGSVANFLQPAKIAGSSIFDAKVLRVKDGLYAGDGGLGANGGQLNYIQVTQDTDGFILKSGNGGAASLAVPRTVNGGAGGAIQNVFVAGLQDGTVTGLLDPDNVPYHQKVQIISGDGGDGFANTIGGAGGIERNVFVGYEVNGTNVVFSNDLLGDSVLLKSGAGGDGRIGGSGGMISSSRIRVQTPDFVGDHEIAIIGGNGGASKVSKGRAGVGATILNVDGRNYYYDLILHPTDPGILVQAGTGGAATNLAFGASGGSLTNVTVQSFDVQALAGDGSAGLAGGLGGSVTNLAVVLDENQQVITHKAVVNAGRGGDSSRRGAGAGGIIDAVTFERTDVSSLLINSGVQGNGGNSEFGVGGAGGLIRNLNIFDGDSGGAIAGLIDIHPGNGGDGGTGGGAGASVINTSVVASGANSQTRSGDGGNATIHGNGGNAGFLDALQVSVTGYLNGVLAVATATAGSGGDGLGIHGNGGIGGGATYVNLNVNNSGTDPLNPQIGGNATLTMGKGGNGQPNFFDASGAMRPGGAPGRGGSILVSGLFSANGTASMIAGDAGDNGNQPAAGGIIIGQGDNVQLVGVRGLDAIFVKGGDGSHGGAGGGISNLSYGSTSGSLTPTPLGDIVIQGGKGSAEGRIAGAGGSLSLIDGSISSDPNSKTMLLAGDGGGIAPASLPVTESVKGTAADREVQIIDLSGLTGVASAKFSLDFGAAQTGLLAGTSLNLASIRAELARIFPNNTPTADLDPLNKARLKITFATTGEQPAIVATGYKGAAAGAGGSVSRVSIFLGGGDNVEFKVEAGDGGDAGPVGRSGGTGGSIGIVGMAGIDAATIVRSFGAGDGGKGLVFGGQGGSVVSVTVEDHDIGIRSGVAYGYTTAGGIFAGVGGDTVLANGHHGLSGVVQDINANSIASIVAGKSATPQMAERVSQITLNDINQSVTRNGALVTNSPFTLTFEENATPAIPGNATREQIQTALNLLPAVQGTGIGQALWIAETTPGTATDREVQTIYLGGITGHANATYQLKFGADQATFNATATPSDVAAGLNALPSVTTAGGVTVAAGAAAGQFKVTFNTFANKAAITGTSLEKIQVTETTPGTVAQREVQTVNLGAIAGHQNATFQLTFGADTTSNIAGSATAAELQFQFNTLASVQTAGGVVVTGATGGPYGLTFGNLGDQTPVSGLATEDGTVTVTNGSSGSYIVSFNSTGNQMILSGVESVPVDVNTTVIGEIITVDTVETTSGAVDVGVVTTLEGEANLPVVELVSGSTLVLSGEQVKGDDAALPPVLEVQLLDLSRLLTVPTGRVNFSFTDPVSGISSITGVFGPVVSAVQLGQALNALPSIVAAGGVSVVQVSPDVFNVTFNTPLDQNSISIQYFLPEKQRVFLGSIATTPGAQFSLTYDPGAAATSTTPLLAGTATLAQIDAALEALPSIQGLAGTVGNKVSVTSAQPGVLDITFNSIDEKNPFVATGFIQETQQVDIGGLSASPTGSYRLSYNGILTAPIVATADSAAIDAALEALSTIQALAGTAGDKVGVTKAGNLIGVTFKSNGDKTELEAVGARPEIQELDVSPLTVTPGSEFTLAVSHNLNVTEKVQGSDGAAIPVAVVTQVPGEFSLSIPEARRGTATLTEVQTINLGAVAGKAGATFTLTFGLDTAPAFPSTATAANVETALNLLQGVIDVGGLTVTGNVGGPFTVTFTTAGDQASILGIGDVPEVQVVELATLRNIAGGQFTLTYGDPLDPLNTTAPLAANATPAQVDAALEALPSIMALNGTNLNKVTVVTGTGGREYQVSFTGIGDKEEMTIAGGGTADREVQTLNLSALSSYGANSRFNLNFDGDTAAVLPGNASAANIDAVLEALPSIQALAPGGNNVTVTTTPAAGVFEIAFNTFGDQPIISGLSQVGPSATQIGITTRLPGNASAADIQAAINLVSQTNITVTPEAVAGTFALQFNENGDQPEVTATEYFHETRVLDIYSIGDFEAQFGGVSSGLLAPDVTADEVDTALEGLTTIQALAGPVGNKVSVTDGPNSSFVILFRADGPVLDDLTGSQFLGLTAGNIVNGFNRDGSLILKEQQVLNYYPKGEFTTAFFTIGNIVGSISDLNELDANVFHYIRNNVVHAATLLDPFQPGDQPIDGLVMARSFDQFTINFTPEARFTGSGFFDNDNII